MNKLRKDHTDLSDQNNKWMGVDVLNNDICNTFDGGIWDPAANKLNSLSAATEAACCILSIDETVRNPQSDKAVAADSSGMGLGSGGGGRVRLFLRPWEEGVWLG